ncbi:MAG: glutamine synthetase [Eubacterium sp.]|nr:glutamine synthetase [Eubacterium sp.]
MKRSKEEIIRYVKEEKIKSIRLAFCDIYGREKNIAIAPEELADAFTYGIPINASAIKDFGEGIYCDLLLHPEPETLATVPNKPDNFKTVIMFCRMTYPDGRPFESRGTKSVLMKAIDCAEVEGFEFFFSSEMQFYLMKLDENGKRTNEPLDEASFLDVEPDDKSEAIRREIHLALEGMEIVPSNMFHQLGPGQNQIDFAFSNPLQACNIITKAKTVIKNVASLNGLYADFSPKPFDDQNGNGMHIIMSVRANDGTDNRMSSAVAGVLDKIDEMTAFLNPTEESYKRLGSVRAPKYISWSSENRAQLLRVPEAVGHYHIAELRSADATVNPYLAFALMIFAGLYGIKNNMELPEASNFDFIDVSPEIAAKYKKLPQSIEEARELARNSEFIKEHLPKDLIELYLNR